MSDTAVGFTFPRAEQRGTFLGLRGPQASMLGLSILVSVFAMVAIPTVLGLGLAVVVFGVGSTVALIRVGGLHVDEWAPVLGRWWTERQRSFVNPVPLWGEDDAAMRSAPPAALSGVAFLEVRRQSGESVGVVRDRRHGTWSGALACRGTSFALLDAVEQERLTGLWGQALAGFAQEGSPVTRIGWVERTVPEEGDALAAFLDRAAVLSAGHPAFDSYAELIASAGPVSRNHETFVVVAIDGVRARKAIKQAGGGDAGATEVVLRELDHLADRLRLAEVEVVERLDARQLAGAVRTAFDPASVAPLAQRGRQQPTRRGVAGRNAWPMAMTTDWDHLRSDSGFHATFHVAEWPRRRVAASFLHPLLLRPTSQHSMAVVLEPIPPSRAARAVESAHANHLADEELRARAGFMETARRRRDHEELVHREEELSRGHAECRFSGYVTVTGRTQVELEFAAGEVEQLGFDAGIELRRLYGQQDLAFTYTLPLARGLARSRFRR